VEDKRACREAVYVHPAHVIEPSGIVEVGRKFHRRAGFYAQSRAQRAPSVQYGVAQKGSLDKRRARKRAAFSFTDGHVAGYDAAVYNGLTDDNSAVGHGPADGEGGMQLALGVDDEGCSQKKCDQKDGCVLHGGFVP